MNRADDDWRAAHDALRTAREATELEALRAALETLYQYVQLERAEAVELRALALPSDRSARAAQQARADTLDAVARRMRELFGPTETTAADAAKEDGRG